MQERTIKNLDLDEQAEYQVKQLCSPRMQNQSSICTQSIMTPMALQKCNYMNQFQYHFLHQILQKPFSNRTHNETRMTNEFIKKNVALNQLNDINGSQFCKGIMRTAVLEEFESHDIIEQKDSDAATVYIVLEGKAASIKNDNQTDMIEHITQRQVYEILMYASRKQSKKISKLSRRFSSFRDYHVKSRQKHQTIDKQQYLEIFEKGQSFGDKVRCFGKTFSHTIIALETTVILSVDIKNVIFWLNRAFQLKLQKVSKLLKSHPFFSHLENDKLEEIISCMCVHKLKKTQVVYSQGQQSSCIYFLQDGELKIQKQSHLFVDNPNELYIDRRKLMTSRERNNKQYLPYANFESLYNYRPINKTIQLGILTPFALFGQQEMIQNKRRQTTIRCNSLKAVYYSVEIKRIQQILNDQTGNFFDEIKTSIKDKIKYRQASYANAMNIENKNNLKYFYVQGQQQTLPTPRKYIIKKLNQKINQNSSKIERQIHKEISLYSQSTYDNKIFNPQIRPFRQEDTQKQFEGSIPPLYNTFNFHKMMRTKLIKDSMTKIAVQEQDSDEINEPRDSQKRKLKQKIKNQQNIISNSHTWQLVRQKVKQENKMSKKIGSFKHDINFTTPLINNKYFEDIQTQMKKIQRDRKIGKFNVSIPKKSRTVSLNAIKMQR